MYIFHKRKYTTGSNTAHELYCMTLLVMGVDAYPQSKYVIHVHHWLFDAIMYDSRMRISGKIYWHTID